MRTGRDVTRPQLPLLVVAVLVLVLLGQSVGGDRTPSVDHGFDLHRSTPPNATDGRFLALAFPERQSSVHMAAAAARLLLEARPSSKSRRCWRRRTGWISICLAAATRQVASPVVQFVDRPHDGYHDRLWPPWHRHAPVLLGRAPAKGFGREGSGSRGRRCCGWSRD